MYKCIKGKMRLFVFVCVCSCVCVCVCLRVCVCVCVCIYTYVYIFLEYTICLFVYTCSSYVYIFLEYIISLLAYTRIPSSWYARVCVCVCENMIYSEKQYIYVQIICLFACTRIPSSWYACVCVCVCDIILCSICIHRYTKELIRVSFLKTRRAGGTEALHCWTQERQKVSHVLKPIQHAKLRKKQCVFEQCSHCVSLDWGRADARDSHNEDEESKE